MPGRRVLLLTVLAVCGGLFIANDGMLAWVLLCWIAVLPWLSLLLSIPAIRSFRLASAGPARLNMGQPGDAMLLGSCPLPMPPFTARLVLTRALDGSRIPYDPDTGLPSSHCGGWTASVEKGRIYDYLGIFSFPVKTTEPRTILVLPRPVPLAEDTDMARFTAQRFRPKPGGGFSENHELRDYRPGDSMSDVHWKLSAKTGSLTVREPVEPEQGLLLLTMTLRGTPETMDRKLGQLLWMGQKLQEQGLTFELRVLTGEGVETLSVPDSHALDKAIDHLLCSHQAESGSIRDYNYTAFWQCHIGGDGNEA